MCLQSIVISHWLIYFENSFKAVVVLLNASSIFVARAFRPANELNGSVPFFFFFGEILGVAR